MFFSEKPQHGDKKARTKIPMLKLKRAMREITENRKKLEENDKDVGINMQMNYNNNVRHQKFRPRTLILNL